jgi:hypothetical protein
MATDIFQLLEKDHREVKSMMKQIAEGNGDGRRRQVFEKFKEELLAHSKCEEREFYTVLQRNEEISDKIEHAYEEHAEVEEALQELADMEEDDEEWMGKFAEMREDLEHHIQEEQDELFPKARAILGEEAEAIGKRFEEAKEQYKATEGEASENRAARRRAEHEAQKAGEHSGSAEEVGTLTRDELYERARKLGIEGRSKMTKNELARAVRARG